MSKQRIRKLESQFDQARRKGRHQEALRALSQLSALQPDEPRWPHQEGDTYRRLGKPGLAAAAFEQASSNYAKAGFVARAVAMAKVLLQLDPSRTDVLERLNPKPAQQAHRRVRPRAVSSTSNERPPASGIVDTAALLERDDSAEDDEVRFLDLAEGSVVELDISELELLDEPSTPQADVGELALLPSFPLFAELPQERLAGLAKASDLVELPPGTLVIRRGEEADALFCICEGEVAIRIEGLKRHPRLGPGDVFGESALLEGARRNADVAVALPLMALRIPREALAKAVEGEPRLGDLLFELLARRLVAALVITSPLFTPFAPAERKQLARRFQLRRAAKGVVLLEQGKKGDALYLLVQGRVRVGDEVQGPGAILGTEVLTGEPASATVKTKSGCVLLRLPRARFQEVVEAHPEVVTVIVGLSQS